MSIIVTINKKGLRVDYVEKIVKAAIEGAMVRAVRVDPPSARAERFADAQGKIEDAKSTAEELRDELQSWFDNLPESLQSGDKASMLEEAIENLDQQVNLLEEAADIEVEFPGMY